MSFKQFICGAVILFAVGVLTIPTPAQGQDKHKIKVLAFDAFPIFDPRPVFGLAEQLFPGHGKELSETWKARLFEYQWQRALSGNYKDFLSVADDALVFAAKVHKLELTQEKKEQLVTAFLNLKVWPDVMPALEKLQNAGYKLVLLSNMTENMLRSNLANNGAESYFAAIYSTDLNRSYKPAKTAYELAIKNLHLKKDEIGFVAFAGWDAAGAKTFGYPTFWVNRQNAPAEELGVTPDWTGNSLEELAKALAL